MHGWGCIYLPHSASAYRASSRLPVQDQPLGTLGNADGSGGVAEVYGPSYSCMCIRVSCIEAGVDAVSKLGIPKAENSESENIIKHPW